MRGHSLTLAATTKQTAQELHAAAWVRRCAVPKNYINPILVMAIVKKSTHDRIEGTAKKARGKVKIAAGKVSGSARLKAKGRADVAEGRAQKARGDMAKARTARTVR